MPIHFAVTREEISRCFPILFQLHPELTEDEFWSQVQRQQRDGYQLVYLEDECKVRSVAGFRITEMLCRGKFLYIDDLVTEQASRSQGYGAALFDWLVAYAREHQCSQVDLDCAVHRKDSHRFYFRQRMNIARYHFDLKLDD